MMQLHFDVIVTQDENVTIASLNIPGVGEFTGSSKRHPSDKHRPEVGLGYALTRLFKRLGERYAQDTQELMGPGGESLVEQLTPEGRDLFQRMFGVNTHKEGQQ